LPALDAGSSGLSSGKQIDREVRVKELSWLRKAATAVVLTALVVGLTATAASASPRSAKNAPGAARPHRHHHHKAKVGKTGPHGPRGATGATGATGPGGPAGPAGTGTPYGFVLKTNAATAPVFFSNGILIEAGCIGGSLELTVRPEGGDHNIVEITSFDNSEGGLARGLSDPEAAINAPIDMLVGGPGVHDYNGLLAVRTLAGQMTTVQWWAMGSLNASQGDCVGGGTVSP
jgi:hypothetical protein